MTRRLPPETRERQIEPLFAHNAALWLRIWLGTAVVALVSALWLTVDAAGGAHRFWRAAETPAFVATLGALVAYHAAGVWGYRWMMRRPWTVLAFVPAGWVLVIFAVARNTALGVLLLSGILQGFLFLPFDWAIVSLAFAAVVLTASAALRVSWSAPSSALARIGWIPAAAVTIGTVLLYIHRSNRDATVRSALLAELRAAQQALAVRERERGAQDERARFARDIHDTLAQGFVSVLRHLDAVELAVSPGAAVHADAEQRRASHIAHARTVSRASLAEIRRLVFALRPTELEAEPLAAALERTVARWSEATGVRATFTTDVVPALRPDAEIIVLRATQEALSNVAQHAGARRVLVSLTAVSGLALLTVEDDGAGFPMHDAHEAERMGLAGMRERARAVDGYVLVDSTQGVGTSVTVALPLVRVAQHESTREEDG